jgi:hypothetical protein
MFHVAHISHKCILTPLAHFHSVCTQAYRDCPPHSLVLPLLLFLLLSSSKRGSLLLESVCLAS